MDAIPHDLIEVKRFERRQAREQARQTLQNAKAQLPAEGPILAAIEALETRVEQLEAR